MNFNFIEWSIKCELGYSIVQVSSSLHQKINRLEPELSDSNKQTIKHPSIEGLQLVLQDGPRTCSIFFTELPL
jgi:G:T/U-mismatch repair DNA glycosylase